MERKIFKNADMVQQGPEHSKMLLLMLGVQSPSSLHQVCLSLWKQKLAQSVGFAGTAVHSSEIFSSLFPLTSRLNFAQAK